MKDYYIKIQEKYLGEYTNEKGNRLLLHNDNDSLTYILNSTALWIWDNCNNVDFDSLLESLCNYYHISLNEKISIEKKLQNILNEMLEKELIIVEQR